MKEFSDLINLVEKSTKLDPWARNTKTKGYCMELINEVNESIQAIEKNDVENLKEELADVLYDWLHACMMAEQEYGIKIKEIIDSAYKKLSHRKPYILENRQVSLKESLEIWKEQKSKEKKK